MDDFTGNDYLKAMTEALQRKIDALLKKIDSKSESLKNSKSKKGIVNRADSLFGKAELKKLHEELAKYRLLDRYISDMMYVRSNDVHLPNTMSEELRSLCALISAKEIENLNKILNACIRFSNNENMEEINIKEKLIKDMLNKLGISNNQLFVKNAAKTQRRDTTFSGGLTSAKRLKAKDFSVSSITLGVGGIDINISYPEELFFKKLEQLIKENKIEKNNSNSKTLVDILIVKELYESKAKISRTLLVISNLLSNVENFDSSKLKAFLKQLEDSYTKALTVIEKKLEQYSLTDLRNQCENIEMQEARERQQQAELGNFQSISYELEKTMQEDPNNYEKIKLLNEEMKRASMHSGITMSERDLAITEGRQQYKKEQEDKRIDREIYDDRVEREQEEYRKEMAILREIAIRELAMTDSLDDEYEVRNGDVYSNPAKRETRIRNRMRDLKNKVDLERSPRAPQNTEHSVYRDYIEYRASLPDKMNFMSFGEYTKALETKNNQTVSIESDFGQGRGM